MTTPGSSPGAVKTEKPPPLAAGLGVTIVKFLQTYVLFRQTFAPLCLPVSGLFEDLSGKNSDCADVMHDSHDSGYTFARALRECSIPECQKQISYV